ncbi:sensor domain-containing diguanylate cyclase [Desulfovibrio ferrophilus]|uniref:diguanylate cyclase n=1 Tax=Desulfovibrio ferrophilus TaxID=241368 RepID=A0A2Z6AVQ2_9BACT|nr:diguanylate cyclase [Desulfovibrio ferrophilus]BBD07266.1 regulatory components of sensory transduction system [Desulfovibrio ferrophilus]
MTTSSTQPPSTTEAANRPIRLGQGNPELLLKVLLDNMPSAVFWKDTNHVYQGCNHKFASMAGFDSPEELIGKSDHDMPWSNSGINECITSDRQVIELGQEMHLVEELCTPDGETLWVEAGKSPIFDSQGTLIGVLGTLINITERRKAEMALAEANAKLEHMAMVDGLTSIPNRRCFDEALEQEWFRAKREQTSLALIFFDVDQFKEFNDTYGHLAGDKALTAIATTIHQAVRRPADLAARYGGEEFAVILQNTDTEGAQHVARQILDAVRELKIPHATGVEGYGIVTLSAGVASLRPHTPASNNDPLEFADQALYTAKDLIGLADRALYAAKKNGRARCEISPLQS